MLTMHATQRKMAQKTYLRNQRIRYYTKYLTSAEMFCVIARVACGKLETGYNVLQGT